MWFIGLCLPHFLLYPCTHSHTHTFIMHTQAHTNTSFRSHEGNKFPYRLRVSSLLKSPATAFTHSILYTVYNEAGVLSSSSARPFFCARQEINGLADWMWWRRPALITLRVRSWRCRGENMFWSRQARGKLPEPELTRLLQLIVSCWDAHRQVIVLRVQRLWKILSEHSWTDHWRLKKNTVVSCLVLVSGNVLVHSFASYL